jgi:hypothetical protein
MASGPNNRGGAADRPRGSNFDYTNIEWADIAAAARGLRDLSPADRRRLRYAAHRYLLGADDEGWLKGRLLKNSAAWKQVASLAEKLQSALAHASSFHVDSHKHLRRLKMLTVLAKEATIFTGPRPSVGRNEVRNDYYARVISVWMDMGGQLKKTRNAMVAGGPQVPGGPLVRFIQAVTKPVMGEDAPTPEGIASVIERQKAQVRGQW